MKNGTTKVQCGCPHEGQDKLHGVGVRVANSTAKGDKDNTEVRCTICKKIHRVVDSKIR